MTDLSARGISRILGPGTLLGAMLAVASLSFVGCHSTAATPATVTPALAPVTHSTELVGTTPVLSSSGKKASTSDRVGPAFDGDAAFTYLKKQCDFGPRPIGTVAHEKLLDYLLKEMKSCADETVTQEFTYRGIKVTNVVGVFYPAGAKAPAKSPVLLLAHWDTRPIADGPESSEAKEGFQYGTRGWNRTTPIMGANDGASGTAILLQLAHMLKQKRAQVGVILLLDDGEDYGDFRANNNEGDGVELGSRYFAKHFRDDKRFGQPSYGILLDMVGAKNLVLPRESLSQEFAPGTNEKVYGIAKDLGYDTIFRYNDTQSVNDDHVALNKSGIPTIDLIHPLPSGAEGDTSSYTYWHTLHDTMDKCSAESLKIVGQTITEVLFRESPESP